MVTISDTNASAIINLLLKHPFKSEEQCAVCSRSEIVGSVIIALFDGVGYMDESPVKKLGFLSSRTVIAWLLEYAGKTSAPTDKAIYDSIKRLEAETGIKICG